MKNTAAIGIFKNTALISILTLFSRILGVIRDMLIASCLGTSFQSDAFFLAFRPFDLARKLFSEGIMNISFVPVFTETLKKQGMPQAKSLFFSCLFIFSLIGSFAVWTGIYYTPALLSIIGPGLSISSEAYELSQTLFRIMSPYIFFILISVLFMGVLNTFGEFGIPALTPVLFNCAMIISAAAAVPLFKIPAISIALGVSIGGFVQLAVQLPFIRRLEAENKKLKAEKNFLDSFSTVFRKLLHLLLHPDPGLTKIALIMIPSMIGAASYQINILLAACFASKLDAGSVSYMYFADRLVQLPIAVFAVSLATVLLTEISKNSTYDKADKSGKTAKMFSNAVKLVFFISIPAMAGMMALSEPIVRLLFGYGSFNDEAVRQTADCLFFLSTGLWAFTGMKVFATLYFSLKQIAVPFYSGLIVILLNLISVPLLMEWLGLKGLLFSVSLSAAAGFVFLFIKLPDRFDINKKDILFSICRTFFISAIMFIIVRKSADMILPLIHTNFWHNVMVILLVILGVLLYALMNLIIVNPDFMQICRKVGKVLIQ